VCERERGRERVCLYVCVCECVCECVRERMCVSKFVCVRERERVREGEFNPFVLFVASASHPGGDGLPVIPLSRSFTLQMKNDLRTKKSFKIFFSMFKDESNA